MRKAFKAEKGKRERKYNLILSPLQSDDRQDV